MKLLKLKIVNKDGFRSLQKGFEINFHTMEDTEAMGQFRPFCFAGLNGSGKSNVLEALANIFYHLEICVAKYLPESIKDPKNFKRHECTPDAFTLEYLIGQHNQKPYVPINFHKIVISKEEGKEPGIKVYEYPYNENNIVIPNPKTLKEDTKNGILTKSGKVLEIQDKIYLPDHIIGYSSGENEILSLPFIKSRLIRLDEYAQYTKQGVKDYEEDLDAKRSRNSLIYIDSNMSQAVLLACLLFEDDETLAPLRNIDNTGIIGLKSFRMNINLLKFTFQKQGNDTILKILEQNQLDKLKKCSTSWFSDEKTLWLDFYVNDATKDAFKHHFDNDSFECFQFFRLLYELNSHFVEELTKEDVYRSKGVYTDGKLPVGNPRQDVFHFLDFYITKELKKTGEIKDLLLRSFSDGEHQFIHTMGICLLLKDKRSILLLDEPETHFNPSWRAKFVKILNDSIVASNKGDHPNGNFNIHLLKDILLTSHSPFIISDCLPDNVVLFEKDDNGDTTAKKASELGIDTYGTSVNLLTNRIFKNKETIGTYAISKLQEFKKRFDSKDKTEQLIEELNSEFGDSIEKLMLIKEMTDKR